MTDYFKNKLKIGDIVASMLTDGLMPKNTKWRIVEIGIEPSTMKKIAIMKNEDKQYLMSAYQSELNFFRKITSL